MPEHLLHVAAPLRALLQALLDNRGRGATGLALSVESQLSPATLHPALAQLERLGWVESRWRETGSDQSGEARCRAYEITSRGAAMAQQALQDAEESRARWVGRRHPAAGKP